MQTSIRFVTLLAFALVLGIYLRPVATAQEKSVGSKTTVTGCLQKGDEPEEYSITGEDGKTYGLRSRAINLAPHLGHKVTITGTLKIESGESAEKEKGEAEAHQKKQMAEAGDIRVTNLKMISDTCK